MWYIYKKTSSKDELIYSDNRSWKVRTRFIKAAENASDKIRFDLYHDNELIESTDGKKSRLNPNVQVTQIPPVFPQRKP